MHDPRHSDARRSDAQERPTKKEALAHTPTETPVRAENPQQVRSISSGSTSLVDLIDRGTYGMGPAGRRASSARRCESVPPSGRDESRRGAWDQGTRASLDQAARASRSSQQRARSAWAERDRPDDGDDPWAAYFNPQIRALKEANPVWGKVPLRINRDRGQRTVVKEGAAELTTGHIPVLRDESINCLLGGPGGVQGNYADGTFGRGGHSTEILRRLSAQGRLWGFDVDPNAVAVGRKLEELLHACFYGVPKI